MPKLIQARVFATMVPKQPQSLRRQSRVPWLEQQHAWNTRFNKEPSLEHFWSTVEAEFPTLFKLYGVVRTVPASSADVERCFKDHKAIAQGRWRLGVKGAESQLVLHSFQKAAGRKAKPKTNFPISAASVGVFLETVSRIWKAKKAASLGRECCGHFLDPTGCKVS